MSSAISDISYDEQSRTLVVYFAKGGSYTYRNVAPEIVAAFRKSGSQGEFFNKYIRS